MIRFRLLPLLLLCVFAPFAVAKDAQPMGEDPAVEQRLAKLSQELRCLVCQNETLADSRAQNIRIAELTKPRDRILALVFIVETIDRDRA